MTFKQRSALAVHAFKKHNRANQIRDYVGGTQCEKCLKIYDSYTDLVKHVKRATNCFNFHKELGIFVERQPGVNRKPTQETSGNC